MLQKHKGQLQLTLHQVDGWSWMPYHYYMKPVACIEPNPRWSTIQIGGEYINLHKLAKASKFSESYLSYIFAGRRSPTLATLQRISTALGMDTPGFVSVLEQYQDSKRAVA